jgi:hypothetical protein
MMAVTGSTKTTFCYNPQGYNQNPYRPEPKTALTRIKSRISDETRSYGNE